MWTAVAITRAFISPYLTAEPEETPSPGLLVAGNDSPVSAGYNKMRQKHVRSRDPIRLNKVC